MNNDFITEARKLFTMWKREKVHLQELEVDQLQQLDEYFRILSSLSHSFNTSSPVPVTDSKNKLKKYALLAGSVILTVFIAFR